ncbi:hypothetical protein BCM02_105276 [Paenibacillus methanolicus]|uniref:Uncharacterized protein n=2 Tax=Paenibacillus methanolicus TaxID=582686 RepID=A0A5S5C5M1_9BACL|nr:hypothetical protein BCM02_105276 [Paenibacillus methanolicus]
MAAVIVLLLTVSIAALELPRLWTGGAKKAVLLYVCMMAAGNVAFAARSFGYALPNPSDWMRVGLAPMTEALTRLGLIAS